MLAVGVPKAVTLYKSKVIERMSRELREKLQDENLTDDEMQDIMQRLSNLNRGKVFDCPEIASVDSVKKGPGCTRIATHTVCKQKNKQKDVKHIKDSQRRVVMRVCTQRLPSRILSSTKIKELVIFSRTPSAVD